MTTEVMRDGELFKIILDGKTTTRPITGTLKKNLEIVSVNEPLSISILKIPFLGEDARTSLPCLPCPPTKETNIIQSPISGANSYLNLYVSSLYTSYLNGVKYHWEVSWLNGNFIESVDMGEIKHLINDKDTNRVSVILEPENHYDIFIYKDIKLIGRRKISTTLIAGEDEELIARGIWPIFPDLLTLGELKLLILKDLGIHHDHARGIIATLTASLLDRKEIIAYFFMDPTDTPHYIITVDGHCNVRYLNHPKEEYYQLFIDIDSINRKK